MSNQKLPIDFVQQLEQMEQMVAQMAIVIGSYREALIDQKIPLEEVKILVRDYHNVLWITAFNKGKVDND